MTSKGRRPATGGVVKLEKFLPPERPWFGGRCRDGSHETVLLKPGWGHSRLTGAAYWSATILADLPPKPSSGDSG